MPHNPDTSKDIDFALHDHDVLALKGPDAVAFAQAQFMNDVGALADGQWQWNGWLTPKGRVIALFALLKLDAETLWLVLPDVLADDLKPLLQRYVFRSKVKLSAPGVRVTGNFDQPEAAAGASFVVMGDGQVELDMSGEGGPRRLVIGTIPVDEGADTTARWAQADLAHGLPRLPASQREQWTPQQLSLDRLRAFSVKKGCYPGQEIVARTHYLGKGKRGLMRLQGAGLGELDEVMADQPAETVTASVRPIGQMVCAAGNEGLAVMPFDAGDGPFSTGNLPCTRLPLLDGLAR